MSTALLPYYTSPTEGPDEIEDFTKAIKAAADSPEAQRRLLVEKQAALERLHPPRPSPERSKEAEPGQIRDPQLRRLYQVSKAREERRGIAPCSLADPRPGASARHRDEVRQRAGHDPDRDECVRAA